MVPEYGAESRFVDKPDLHFELYFIGFSMQLMIDITLKACSSILSVSYYAMNSLSCSVRETKLAGTFITTSIALVLLLATILISLYFALSLTANQQSREPNKSMASC